MLSRIRNWISGAGGEENLEAAAHKRAKVVYNLKKLQTDRCFIDVRFPDRDKTTFQTLILEVDSELDQLTIDELYPADDIGDVTAGDVLELTSRQKGMRMSFVTKIERIEHDGNSPLFHLQIPASVKAKQQRKHFRVRIQSDSGIKVNVFDKKGLTCVALNLSADGIGFHISGNHTDFIKFSGVLEDFHLKLPNNVSMHCGLEIRSVEFKKQPNRRTLIGASFLNLSPQDRKKIENYVVELQRIERKSEIRGH